MSFKLYNKMVSWSFEGSFQMNHSKSIKKQTKPYTHIQDANSIRGKFVTQVQTFTQTDFFGDEN